MRRRGRARVEPARVEPARVEPERVEPERVEPARVEPARSGQARSRRAWSGQAQHRKPARDRADRCTAVAGAGDGRVRPLVRIAWLVLLLGRRTELG